MNLKRKLIVVFLLLFCKVGFSQNIQIPSADSIYKKEVSFINDLINIQEYDEAIDKLKSLVLSLDNEAKKGYCYWLLYFSYSSKGDIEATLNNYIEAKQLYNSALQYLQINNEFLKHIDFTPFETYTSRGICYAQLKDYKSAIFDFDKAISLLNDNKGSFLDAGATISLNNQYGLAFYYRGLMYHNLGDLNEACTDYLNASKYDYPVESRLIEGCNALR